MSIIFPDKNYQNNNPQNTGYDLNAEKERIAQGTEEIKKELLEKWKERYAHAQIFPDTISTINLELINLLLSFQNTLFYNDIAKKFGLNQEQRDILPQVVWHVCKNRAWGSTESLLQKNLNLSQSVASQIYQILDSQLLQKAKSMSAEAVNARQSLPETKSSLQDMLDVTLSQALQQFPEIGEQLITSDRINIKSFPEPARPSIKNWIADYTFVLGYGTHDAIARANYMFQGTNARNLASADRERLAYILKAYDENTLVTVDKNEKKIVFPANNQETRNNNQANFKSQTQNLQMHSSELNSQESRMNLKSSTLGTPSTPRSSAPEAQNPQTNKISYSSPQKLPYEKMRTQQQPYRITPIYGQQKKEEPKKDERILNKNVVDLRDSM